MGRSGRTPGAPVQVRVEDDHRKGIAQTPPERQSPPMSHAHQTRPVTDEPFFTVDGEGYRPNEISSSPWNLQALHGRVIVGLLGFELERQQGGPDWLPARFTVDMFSAPPFGHTTVTTRVVRESGRIRVIDAELVVDGVVGARASCQFLKLTEAPPRDAWSPPGWDEPAPGPAEPEDRLTGYKMWNMRFAKGKVGADGPKRAWCCEARELVEGMPLTPFAKVALTADYVSPLANAAAGGLAYINTDVTAYLHRLPVGDWIGMEVTDHGATAGVAVGQCRLHDAQGPIGSATCTGLANRMRERR